MPAHLACWHTLGQGVHVVTVGGAHVVIGAQRPDDACSSNTAVAHMQQVEFSKQQQRYDSLLLLLAVLY
jgi:hypothetical protein